MVIYYFFNSQLLKGTCKKSAKTIPTNNSSGIKNTSLFDFLLNIEIFLLKANIFTIIVIRRYKILT